MKTLPALAILLIACGGGSDKPQPQDTTSGGHPSSHIVFRKIEPDTLVDENGLFCRLLAHGRQEDIQIGTAYEKCMWSDTAIFTGPR